MRLSQNDCSLTRKLAMSLHALIQKIESKSFKATLPRIEIGDTVKVGVVIQEGNKQRVQPYQGVVIAQRRAGLHSTITVRRIFQGVGIERIFPVHSPSLQNLEIIRRAKVRRAKLYYLRDRVGKATRLKARAGEMTLVSVKKP